MPCITSLQSAKRKPDRVHVHVDGEYAFTLPADVAAALCEGQAISKDRLAELRGIAEYGRALERSMRFLSYRPRSRHEMMRYLAGKQTPADVARKVAQRLEDLGLIDDEQFCRWWVDNRSEHQPRGPWILRRELTERGVAESLAKEAVERIDESELARRLALQRAGKYTGLERPVFERRLGNLLLRRGFSSDVAREAVRIAWHGDDSPTTRGAQNCHS